MKKHIEYSVEVKNAIENNLPIVALESTIISHGMPYPQNVETALLVEEEVRKNGAIPATIAIIKGKIKVGLSHEEIEYLGKKGLDVIKTSRRDIATIVTRQLDGATTVAATMIIANMANIKIFATGGIGGVHYGAEKTFDISADLEELSRTNVAVVCAGIKSILDLDKTLEYLETKGVPVIGVNTDILPAFYTNKSHLKLDYNYSDLDELAHMLKNKWDLNIKGGVVIANPIPDEYSMDQNVINSAIKEALEELEKLGIKGKDSTPYLLSKVKEITKGSSLDSNIKLVLNNAKVASIISKNYYNIVE